jgi:hypothetical protein
MINEKNTLTSLSYWFPRVKDLGITVPRTEIIPCDPMELLQGTYSEEFIIQLIDAASRIGYPVFMRTDLCSGKHNWKNTCFVPDQDALIRNLYPLAEFNELADICGLPYTSIVLREFLNLEIGFEAFPGKMPINKERRYFIRDGEILCHHPYWPLEAFRGGSIHVDRLIDSGENKEWREKLNDLNREDPEEIALLTSHARQVSHALPGFWSVDFAKTKNGPWYLIDMAVGQASYHWKGCPNENLRVRE